MLRALSMNTIMKEHPIFLTWAPSNLCQRHNVFLLQRCQFQAMTIDLYLTLKINGPKEKK